MEYWKDALLKELYSVTHDALLQGLQNPAALADRLRENKQEAKDELLELGISEAIIDSAWQHTSDDYFFAVFCR